MHLAQRVAQLAPSATLSITAQAKAMAAAGIPICNLGAGEPDFPTPAHIRRAAIQALDQGKTRYGPTGGIPQLRQAIANKLQQDNQLSFSAAEVMVSNGGKQTLYNLMMVMLDPGDEVIIPAPYWVSYPDMVRLAGGIPVIVPTSIGTGFKITPEGLQAALTPRTKLVVLNSPNNPTGAVYSREELADLGMILAAHDCWIVCDEIYEKLIYDDLSYVNIVHLHPELKSRLIISNGFAKAYSMTGWRIGYLAAPQAIIDAAINLQSHSTSNVCTFAQYGALQALIDPLSLQSIAEMRQELRIRRNLMMAALDKIAKISYFPPGGAFYLWVNIEQTGLDSLSFCERLLKDFHLAAIPGIAFGCEGWIRLSYAASRETLLSGVEALNHCLDSLG
ncbi:MAG: pyridoxal phosphate-dependent aminotransferase [Thermostichales cyanobacterium BF4_bins_65]